LALFLTQDQESSRVTHASTILGEGWHLLVQQAHSVPDVELVEGGQLFAHYIPPAKNFG